MKRSYALAILARLLRFAVVVPLTALTLHGFQPQIPWWSWCGVSVISLVFLWLIDGCVACSQWRKRRRTATPP